MPLHRNIKKEMFENASFNAATHSSYFATVLIFKEGSELHTNINMFYIDYELHAIWVKFETDFTAVATVVLVISQYTLWGAVKAKYIALLHMVFESFTLNSD